MLAFYTILLADFPGLAELGFIAGSGIAMGLLASFTLLPALLAISAPYVRVYPGTWQTIPPDPLRRLRRFPRATLGLCGLFTLAGLVINASCLSNELTSASGYFQKRRTFGAIR